MLIESSAKKTLGFKSFIVEKVHWLDDGLIIEAIPLMIIGNGAFFYHFI